MDEPFCRQIAQYRFQINRGSYRKTQHAVQWQIGRDSRDQSRPLLLHSMSAFTSSGALQREMKRSDERICRPRECPPSQYLSGNGRQILVHSRQELDRPLPCVRRFGSAYEVTGSLVVFLVGAYDSSVVTLLGAERIQVRRTRAEWLPSRARAIRATRPRVLALLRRSPARQPESGRPRTEPCASLLAPRNLAVSCAATSLPRLDVALGPFS